MNKKLLGLVITATVVVAFIAYAAYLLVGVYPDVLITAQDRNIYSADSLYFSQQVARPFGLFQYIGAYLTQYFYHPAIGAALLIAMWTASAFVGIKAFRLKGIWRSLMIIPAACLLASELDLGYWVYCLTIPGYWFSQSVAFLVLMLLLWAANATPRRFRLVWYAVVGFVLFPVLGWISYIFAVCLALSQFVIGGEKNTKPDWKDLIGIVLTVAAPFVFRLFFYETINSDEVLSAGFPFFKTSTNSSLRPVIPFFILSGATVVSAFGGLLPALKKIPASVAYVLVGIASAYAVWATAFKDENYLYEIQMTQATMVDDWQSVISVAEKTKTPSRTMVMLKNIALYNTGELSRSFELSNDGKEIYNPDTLNINIMHIASPLIYYNHGVVNYAIRWCMEFSVPYGFSPYYLKTFIRCAEATGEKELARRYLDRLHGLHYYKDWQPTPVTPAVKELMSLFSDALDNDDNSCERYIIKRFDKDHHVQSPRYCELNLLYAMIIRDPSNFWAAFYDYVNTHKGEPLPTQYQEAFCLFMDQAAVNFPIQIDISPEIASRYKAFLEDGSSYAKYLDENGTREAMRPEWGETYWWFNAFGRQYY